MKKTAHIFFLITVFTGISSAQEVSFEQISTAHGLSQSNVTCMTYDSNGFLWIGTDDGLNRYDGYNFKVFEYQEDKPYSLPSSAIRSIYTSESGILWIGTVGGGICRYDQDIDGFITYKNIPGDNESLSDNTILTIAEDELGNLWVGTEKGGLNKLTFNGNDQSPSIISFQYSEREGSLNNNYVHSIYSASNGDLIIGTWGGINILKKTDFGINNIEEIIFDSITADGNSGLSHNAVRTIVEGKENGVFWIGTWGGGLDRMVIKEGQYIIDNNFSKSLISATNSYKYIANLYQDIEGQLWIGSFEKGLAIYNPNTQETTKYSNDDLGDHYISSNFVSTFVSDSTGITWVGTYGGGLNKYDDVEQPFKLFQQSEKADCQLSNNLIFAIYQDIKERMWVGTHGGGLNKLEKNDSGFQLTQVYRAGAIPSDIILTISEDQNERLWIGSREGLAIYNNQNDEFELVPDQPDSVNGLWGKFIWKIYRDSYNDMWVGTRRGLNKWDSKNNRYFHFYHSKEELKSLSNDNVYSIFEDSRGYLWVGTANGLNLKTERTNRNDFIKYQDLENSDGIVGNIIYSIAEDKNENIWIGTNRGLSCLILKVSDEKDVNVEYRTFTVEDGLIDNVIYGLLLDKNGHFWISTNEGLSHFDPEEILTSKEPQDQILNYDQSDGLQSNEFNMGAFYKSEDGYLYFGGNNGMSSFDPSNLIRNDKIPPIAITSITVNNESKPIPSDGVLELTWRDHALTIEYAALNYRKTNKNQYAYQMKSVDVEKIYAEDRKYVNYTNLNPGDYVFHVEGSNNDDVWNRKGTTLEVTVLPPPWKTWWAYGLYLSILATTFFMYGRYRSQEEKRKREMEVEIEKAKFEERERVRKKSSQDFHDELGNKLTKVSLLTGLLKTKVDKREAQKLIEKVEENTKLISSGLRDFIWILDSDKGTLTDLIERIVQFGNALFEHSTIRFISSVDSNVKERKILDIDMRRHIVLLFKESMNNALKYSSASEVIFRVEDKEELILFLLKDNGVGFELDREQDGYGLKNMMSRANQMGASLEIITEEGKGVVIKLSI